MDPNLAIGLGFYSLARRSLVLPGTLAARLEWVRSGQTERITWRAVAGFRSRKALPSTSATNFRSRAPETHPTPARRGVHLSAAQRDFRLAGAERLSAPDFGSRRRLTPRRELRSDGQDLSRGRLWDPPPRRFRPRAASPSNLWHSLRPAEHRLRPPTRLGPSFLPRVNATGVSSPRAPSTSERSPHRRSGLTIRDVSGSPCRGTVRRRCLFAARRSRGHR